MSLSRLACRLTRRCLVAANYNAASVSSIPSQSGLQVQQCRTISISTQRNDKLATKTTNSNLAHSKNDWNRAISAAEKLVGYPTSFLSLRWLLSDEIANVALHLRKLVGSSHPLLKTAKYAAEHIVYISEDNRHLLYNGKNNVQAWGLVVLLISKAAGQASSHVDLEQDQNAAGLLQSQRVLAEATEMIRISHLVHQGLVNLQPLAEAGQDLALHDDMTFGNKIALLSGDYLLGNSCAELATLRNQELVELISSAVRDLAESEFIGDRDEQNNALPFKPEPERTAAARAKSITTEEEDVNCVASDNLKPMDKNRYITTPEQEWTMRHILSGGSLLGKSCQGTLKLAGHSDAVQSTGYLFGKHLALAWQAALDLEPFQQPQLPQGTTFSLISAPVLLHLDYDPSMYAEIQKGRISIEDVDYAKIHADIIASGPALETTRDLQRKHSLAAMKMLNQFPPSDARTALQNIILAMQDM